MPALTSTVGRLGGDIMVKQVADMARGSSGASEVEKGYLDAPYTQVTPLRPISDSVRAPINRVDIGCRRWPDPFASPFSHGLVSALTAVL